MSLWCCFASTILLSEVTVVTADRSDHSQAPSPCLEENLQKLKYFLLTHIANGMRGPFSPQRKNIKRLIFRCFFTAARARTYRGFAPLFFRNFSSFLAFDSNIGTSVGCFFDHPSPFFLLNRGDLLYFCSILSGTEAHSIVGIAKTRIGPRKNPPS